MTNINNLDTKNPILFTLENLSPIVSRQYGLLKNISRVRQYYDDIKYWHYSATIDSNFARNDGHVFSSKSSGVSLISKEVALVKCLGESIERLCNHLFKNDSTILISSTKDINEPFVDPKSFASFSNKQLKNNKYKQFRISDKSIFSWTDCYSLIDNHRYLVPSQLIYLSYPHLKDEPSIYPGISTGVAGGSTIKSAIIRGLCEVVERDSFVIYYMNKITPKYIDLVSIKNRYLEKIVQDVKRYNFELKVFDLTTDIGIPVCASVLINKTGIGKAISLGLKCDFDPVKAIIGSIEEALHTRSWVRTVYEKCPKNIGIKQLENDSSLINRALYWYGKKSIKKLGFWLNSKESMKPKIYRPISNEEKLKIISEIFTSKKYNIYYKEITLDIFRQLNYHIIKVIVPQLQPLFLNEKYPLLGGERIKNVPLKIEVDKRSICFNKIPHPFL